MWLLEHSVEHHKLISCFLSVLHRLPTQVGVVNTNDESEELITIIEVVANKRSGAVHEVQLGVDFLDTGNHARFEFRREDNCCDMLTVWFDDRGSNEVNDIF